MNRFIDQIADKRNSEKQLINAIRNLGPVTEPSQFWMNIANDPSYRTFHRRHAIFQLFYRHLRPGITLLSAASILQKPIWLEKENIYVIEDIGGHIPVVLSSNNTVLVLNILPEILSNLDYWQIYLNISGKITAGDFFNLLNGESVDMEIEKSRIVELGFSPLIIESGINKNQ